MLTDDLTDEVIVERVMQGETALFETIMRRHNQQLYRLVRALLNDDHEAEDVLQTTYVRAFEHLAQFEGRARLSTWIARIALNEGRARIRRRRREIAGNRRMAATVHRSHAAPPETGPATAELTDLVTRALQDLPRQMRVVFVLREVEGLTVHDTAELLGLTPANVKVRLHRARHQLRLALEQALGAEAKEIFAFDGELCDRIVKRVLELLGSPSEGTAAPSRSADRLPVKGTLLGETRFSRHPNRHA